MDTYTVDANALLYYLVDALPPAADEVFRETLDSEAVLQLPAIAAAESLYVVRNRNRVAGDRISGDPSDVMAAIESYLPVTVVDTDGAVLGAMVGWMDEFPYQLHDALIVASHEVHGTTAVISRDDEIAKRATTVWA